MSESGSYQAEQLNRSCECAGADLPLLHQRLDTELGRPRVDSIVQTHPHLFTDTPIFLDAENVREMRETLEAIEAVVRLPGYQQAALSEAPGLAQLPQASAGVFLGYDFHISPEGPRLIEINTNAGGAILLAYAQDARRQCCPEVTDPVPRTLHADLATDIVAMFQEEWSRMRQEHPLRTIAIVDDAPQSQYLYPEFLLAQSLFESHGIRTRIVDAASLVRQENRLLADGLPIDLVYNRLTDFYFENPRYEALRQAYQENLAVVTPHPRAHALYADKGNLAHLSDGDFLQRIGAPSSVMGVLSRAIPSTSRVAGDGGRWWTDRRNWFFKPRLGFGSRGGYRGEKITRRVHQDIMQGDYVAQRFTPAPERWRTAGASRQAFKFDVRCYVYSGRVQHIAARMYQGQTTNFRTAGGGFAPVYVVGNPTPARPSC